jgi:hypothetical protein
MEGIKLFMWGYQRCFQISVQVEAEKLFQALDPGFEVETFLLGLVCKESPEDHPICLEPEECGFEPDDFASVRDDAKQNLAVAVAAGRNMITWQASAQSSIDRCRNDRANKSAVIKALAGKHNRANGEFFFSGFMPVANYDVGIVLRLNHRYRISHYRLPHTDESLQVPKSLVESAVNVFLQACRKSLNVPNPESVEKWDGPDTDEMLRKAGARLMEAPVLSGGGVWMLYELFNACNYIASLTYERATSIGEILIARSGHQNIQPTFTLAKPVALSEHRAVRKLLEISSAKHAILTDGSSVTGFGKFVGNYDQSKADLFKVLFMGHHKWELCHADQKLMRVTFGTPTLPLPSLNKHMFAADLERIFKGISANAVNNLFELSEEACRQRHGTVLVVTPEAAAESKRLASQATGLVPVSLTPELVKSVTAIDGAVMLDTSGVCHAIGVILDGEAVEFGNPARGARFNSSLRYYARMENRKKDCLVVVISEDGTAEWIPELRPRLSLRELKAKEDEADSILLMTQFPISRTQGLLIWFSKHRFYLPQSLCDKANRLEEKRIEALKDMRSKGTMVISSKHEPFEPHPDMSDDYLEE